jgi:hypothetical protein
MITRQQINTAIRFPEFLLLNQSLLLEGKTTGLTQTEEYVEFGRLNITRMQRLMKTVVLNGELRDILSRLSIPHTLIIITEGWCGDSAQIVPVLEHMRLACPFLDVVFLIRDENPQVMDQFLTNGARSIPKVVCVETTSLDIKWEWGPRPSELQSAVKALLAQQVTHAEKSVFVQNWYNQNKTQAIQSEIMRLVQTLLSC